MSDEPVREYLKVSDVAKILNADIQTVYRLIKAGELLALDMRQPGSPQATMRITRPALDLYVAMAQQRGLELIR